MLALVLEKPAECNRISVPELSLQCGQYGFVTGERHSGYYPVACEEIDIVNRQGIVYTAAITGRFIIDGFRPGQNNNLVQK